jgi:DNA invertase Pin-like site-specific DNA recombinase
MKRVALYARTSTDKTQSVENQLRVLQEVGTRLGWTIIAVHKDEGISGAKGRDRRPGFDALMRSITRGEVDLIAAWSVDRLGRSLSDLVAFLSDVQARGVDLYLHQQAVDSSSPSGRMLFALLGLFAEFERSIIVERVKAGLQRTRAKGTRLGRPPMPEERVEQIRTVLASGQGIRATARITGASTTTVMRIARSMQAGEAKAA